MKHVRRGLHKEQIKAQIRMRGVTVTGLSVSWGFDRSAISKALETPCPNVEIRIADFLGAAVQDIWPDRYGPQGQRLASPINCNENSNAKNCSRNSQVKAAA